MFFGFGVGEGCFYVWFGLVLWVLFCFVFVFVFVFAVATLRIPLDNEFSVLKAGYLNRVFTQHFRKYLSNKQLSLELAAHNNSVVSKRLVTYFNAQ